MNHYESIKIVIDEDDDSTNSDDDDDDDDDNYDDDDSEITQDEDSNDDNHYPSTELFNESGEAENNFKEPLSLDLRQGTMLIVFWSCILKFLKGGRTCFQPAKISKIFHKGTKIIVDVICQLKDKYSWHSQPNETDMGAGNIYTLIKETLKGTPPFLCSEYDLFLSLVYFF